MEGGSIYTQPDGHAAKGNFLNEDSAFVLDLASLSWHKEDSVESRKMAAEYQKRAGRLFKLVI